MTTGGGNAERVRQREAREDGIPWMRWGPYLSERQWGTVREDYSENGDAWSYFPHDHARSRAYRWGEDGLAGISDERQRLCFALALWNGRDPYGNDFTIECPTGSGQQMTLYQVAAELNRRLTSIFVRDESGRRPVLGDSRIFQDDPNWRDHVLLYEYFHGDDGRGLGASHQTGWTGLVARAMHLFASMSAEDVLAADRALAGSGTSGPAA